MEPPLKRQRTCFEGQHRDLQQRRARNDQRLKSRFEAIFEKFGKDFSGVGDEIDLKTGQIVVDNGHVSSMRDEQDIGFVDHADGLPSTSPAEATALSVDGSLLNDLRQRASHRDLGSPSLHRSDPNTAMQMGEVWEYEECLRDEVHADVDLERKSTLWTEHDSLSTPARLRKNGARNGGGSRYPYSPDREHLGHQRLPPREIENATIDPKWQVPFIPPSTCHLQDEDEPMEEEELYISDDSENLISSSLPGQSLWAMNTFNRKGRQRVSWSPEVSMLLKKATSRMLEDIRIQILATDRAKSKLQKLPEYQNAGSEPLKMCTDDRLSSPSISIDHGVHAHPKQSPFEYWDKKISDPDERRRFVRHAYNKRACKWLERRYIPEADQYHR